jgi:hypothetical protein
MVVPLTGIDDNMSILFLRIMVHNKIRPLLFSFLLPLLLLSLDQNHSAIPAKTKVNNYFLLYSQI